MLFDIPSIALTGSENFMKTRKSLTWVRPLSVVRRCGFTLVELLVVIVIIVALAAIIFPIAARVKKKAQASQCMSNLRQLAIVVRGEASDLGHFPPVNNQTKLENGSIQNNGENVGVLINHLPCVSCPAARFKGTNKRGNPISAYGTNPMVMGYYTDGKPPLVRTTEVRRPSEVWMMSDSAQFTSNPRSLGYSARWWGNRVGNPADRDKELTTAEIPEGGFWDPDESMLPLRHDGTANVVFCDGHAETIKQIGDLKQKNYYTNY
ncbi:prepilin-type N-terminal cleavage/methylation domain-containing protein [Haloferula sp.]|uniref:prepilin-type N-terminal cleavage/methylation domain-containing protein n=1 Tax=Haloferula sp. TaxID=2497595 RepID=UPI003C78C538